MRSSSFIVSTLALAVSIASAADLTVEIKAFRPNGGPVIVALYRNANDFPIPEKRAAVERTPTDSDTASVVFRDIEAGRYAVVAYQDTNGNGRLDKNLLGIPTEIYGFSNDARGRMGPPSFEDAAFSVTDGAKIIITLR